MFSIDYFFVLSEGVGGGRGSLPSVGLPLSLLQTPLVEPNSTQGEHDAKRYQFPPAAGRTRGLVNFSLMLVNRG